MYQQTKTEKYKKFNYLVKPTAIKIWKIAHAINVTNNTNNCTSINHVSCMLKKMEK